MSYIDPKKDDPDPNKKMKPEDIEAKNEYKAIIWLQGKKCDGFYDIGDWYMNGKGISD